MNEIQNSNVVKGLIFLGSMFIIVGTFTIISSIQLKLNNKIYNNVIVTDFVSYSPFPARLSQLTPAVTFKDDSGVMRKNVPVYSNYIPSFIYYLKSIKVGDELSVIYDKQRFLVYPNSIIFLYSLPIFFIITGLLLVTIGIKEKK